MADYIELIENLRYDGENCFGELQNKLVDIRNNENDEEVKTKINYEIDICGLYTTWITEEQRFASENVNDLSEEQIKYYETRLQESNNDYVICKYGDFLFEYFDEFDDTLTLKKYEIAKLFLPCMLTTLEAKFEFNFHDFTNDLFRIIDISIRMKFEDCLVQAIQIIREKISIFYDKDEPLIVTALSTLCINIYTSRTSRYKDKISEDLLNEIISVLDKLIEKNSDYFVERAAIEEKIMWLKALKVSKEEIQSVSDKIGESFERQGDASNEPHFYEEAIKYYKNTGNTQKVDNLKVKLRKAYKASSKNMHKIETEPISLPTWLFELYSLPFIKPSLKDSLLSIANSDMFIPKSDTVKKTSSQMVKDHPLLSLASRISIDHDKKISEANDIDEHIVYQYKKIYVLEISLCNTFLMHIIHKLIEKQSLNSDAIIELLDNKNLIEESNKQILRCGFDRYFDKDYISAMHILVPQFEMALRTLLLSMDFPLSSISKQNIIQQEKTLIPILDQKDVEECLKPNVHEYISLFLADQDGMNIRNKLAHGLIGEFECNENNCTSVIYLFLVLLRY